MSCMLASCFQYLDIFIAACQEEKDQARNQNPGEPERRNKHHPACGHRKGPCGMSESGHVREHQEHDPNI